MKPMSGTKMIICKIFWPTPNIRRECEGKNRVRHFNTLNYSSKVKLL